MHYLGLYGMPRRIPMYPLMYLNLNQLCSAGATVSFLSAILFFFICFKFLYSDNSACVPFNFSFFNINYNFFNLSKFNSFSLFIFFDLIFINIFYLQPASFNGFVYYNLHIEALYLLLGVFGSVILIYALSV